MNISPQGKIRLLNTPLEKDMKNTLKFANVTAQTNYFISKIEYTISDTYTYVRKDGSLKISKTVDELYNCNYLMYQNYGFTNKWFYAFIDRIEYVDEKTSQIFFTTDAYQTWCFDINILDSFVKREHTNNDTIGANTLPEGLESGEYILNQDSTYSGLNAGCVCIASNYNPYTNQNESTAYYHGLFSGITYFIFPVAHVLTGTYYDSASKFIEKVTADGKLDAIQTVFIVPQDLVDYIAPEDD
jgi:hypothetical protein